MLNPGYRDGTLAEARFSYPNGMAIDRSGNVLVADSANSLIRKIAPNGMVSTVAGSLRIAGSADGPASKAQFNNPADVAIDAAGSIYVADFPRPIWPSRRCIQARSNERLEGV